MSAPAHALVILLLAGLGAAAAPPGALPGVLWFAFTTDTLVRSDLASRRLPNWATLTAVGVVAISAALAPVVDGGAQDPGLALVAIAAVAVGGWFAARTGALGLGDVKLAAALTGSLVLVNLDALAAFAVVSAAAGVVGIVVGRGRAGTWPASMPYGPCLLVGYWSALVMEAASASVT